MEITSIGRKWRNRHNDNMYNTATTLPTDPAMVTPRLIALREALGMSKAEFADLIGIDRSSYTKMEKSEKPVLPHTAYRIWQLFSVDMNYLYLGQVGGLPSNISNKVIANLKSLD